MNSTLVSRVRGGRQRSVVSRGSNDVWPLQVGDDQAPKRCKGPKRAKVSAKLIRQVEVAAREGGGDVNSNASLRTMFQKARDASVPIDTIEQRGQAGHRRTRRRAV